MSQEQIDKMAGAVNVFSEEMHKRMVEGHMQGLTGWDTDQLDVFDLMQKNFDDGSAQSMVDIANLAMMRHRQLMGVNE